jgi:hypothetical protein
MQQAMLSLRGSRSTNLIRVPPPLHISNGKAQLMPLSAHAGKLSTIGFFVRPKTLFQI